MSETPTKKFILPLLFLAILSSCRENKRHCAENQTTVTEHQKEGESSNSIYHWKTTFNLDSVETAFLKTHSIRRMYMRLFDVDQPQDGQSDSAIPIATTVFMSDRPAGVEIVPTVFITVRALTAAASENSGSRNLGIKKLAGKIYLRVRNMSDYNDLGPVREIQLDCDWTKTTREDFYSLCEEISKLAHRDSINVSATIRLHQLTIEAPPVDRGVLMVYNTGALRRPGAENSILSYGAVQVYLDGKPAKGYGLPLDFAFPVFSWGVLFRDKSFQCILHKSDFSDKELYAIQDNGTYLVKRSHTVDGHELEEGDVIRLESHSADLVDKVAELVTSSFPGSSHNIILYHLDSEQLLKYTDDEIARIYSY